MDQRAQALTTWAMCRDSWMTDQNDRVGEFTRRGFGRYREYVKAAVDAHTAADEGVALQPLRAAFVDAVDREALSGRLEGAHRVPLGVVSRLQTGTVTATAVAEGGIKPVGRIAFTVSGLPSKAVGQIVVTAEYLRSINTLAQEGITRSLVSATAAALDVEFITAFTAGAPAGSSDVGTLLAAISDGAPTRPYIIGGYDTLIPLAGTLADIRALGVGVLATPAAAGLLLAVDAAGVLVAEGGAEVMTARHADVQLDDSTGGSPGSVVSLWQANLAALKAEVQLAFRPDAVAWSATGTP